MMMSGIKIKSIQTKTFLLVCTVVAIFDAGVSGAEDETSSSISTPNQPKIELSGSGSSIPLIGFGIGNLPHESIPQVVNAQLGAGAQLIDTAFASNNEKILAESIADFDALVGSGGLTRGGGQAEDLAPLHVVTKVWYTYLGGDRTLISVRESLENLRSASSRQIYVHMLLHWPRCNDDVPWMNCEEEEANLPRHVKKAGPPPHLHKNAFLDSWKALEEVYLEHQAMMKTVVGKDRPPLIASIGVSNFELDDMKQLLLKKPRVLPQIYQGNAWKVFHDPWMMTFLKEHGIFFQAYAVMHGILQRRDDAPNAYHMLFGLARELSIREVSMDELSMATSHSEEQDAPITEATMILAYFLHANVGVIPRAASPAHQHENSPEVLSAILPRLTSSHIEQLEIAIPSLMKGEDVHLSVHFMNGLEDPIQIHWLNPETNEEVLVSDVIHPGSAEMHRSHPGHRFVAYDPDRTVRKEFLVDVGYGEDQAFKVEL